MNVINGKITKYKEYLSKLLLFLLFPIIIQITNNQDVIQPTVENFAKDFYTKLAKDSKMQDKSIIFSPTSIQMAGALIFSGASGKTAIEMVNGFKLISEDKKIVGESFRIFLNNLNHARVLAIANKIYVKTNITIASEFNQIAKDNFQSETENINFANSMESAQKINKWVEANTGGKVKEFVENDAFGEDTRMFLVNAVHFKAEWLTKFKKEHTELQDFFTTPTKTVKVEMMKTVNRFNVGNYKDLRAVGIELPFKDSDLSLFVLKPARPNEKLSIVEDQLQDIELNELFKMVKPQQVALVLPKFKIELSIDMQPVLMKMQMLQMFGPNANFSNLLATPEPLYLSKAIHKAFIEINEEGTEAGASTGMGIQSRIAPLSFDVNQSFLYFIKGQMGEIYFMGRFTGQ